MSREIRVRAFPALPGSSCCLENGDWPLDPHEILLNPRDLDKLRVPAYGYVLISSSADASATSDSSGEGDVSRKSSVRNSEDGLHTFCRVVPEDSLSPGEARAPGWTLRALGDAEHLVVKKAVTDRGNGDAVSEVELVVHDASSQRHLSAAGSTIYGRACGLGKTSNEPDKFVGDVSRHLDLGRAIARRCCGCMVRPGSLLGAEILGETLILRVESIAVNDKSNALFNSGGASAASAVVAGCGAAAGDGGVVPLSIPASGCSTVEHHHNGSMLRDNATGTATGANDEDRQYRCTRFHGMTDGKKFALFLIDPKTEVTLLKARVASVADGVLVKRGGGRKQQFSARCGGRKDLWTQRAPSLEPVLDELHSLVLLAVGRLNGADLTVTRPRGGTEVSYQNHSSSGGKTLRALDILPNNIIICGPSGVGKTLALDVLAEDVRERHGVHVIRVLGPEVLAGLSHGGGRAIDSAAGLMAGSFLAQSLATARNRAPSILILDELDAVFDSMGEGVDAGSAALTEGARAGAALLAILDSASSTAGAGVAVVGATRYSFAEAGGAGWADQKESEGGEGIGWAGTAIPAAFRKPGRFDRCVEIGPPTQAGRERILRVLLDVPGWQLKPSRSGWRSSSAKTSERWAQTDAEGLLPLESQDVTTRFPRGTADEEGGGIPDDRETLREWARRLSSLTPGMLGGDLDRLVRTARAGAASRSRINSTSREPGAIDTRGENKNISSPLQSRSPACAAIASVRASCAAASKTNLSLTNGSLLLTWQDVMRAVAVTVPRSLKGMDIASSSHDASSGDSGGGPTWASVGGFSKSRRRLQRLVQWPWQHPEAFAKMGISAPAGALLYGPSGCGKSLVAQVLANECLANFVWVRSSELLSRYLGETEAKLRALFARARAAAPCILFLDELDSITAKRGDGGTGDSGSGGAGGVYARVLSTLLNEMDGVAGGGALQPKRLASVPVSDTNAVGSCAGSSSSSVGATCAEEGEAGADRAAGGVLVLAATSRRDMLDSALLRPGRLHESVEFGMPEKEDREEVLRVHTRRLPLAGGVDLERLSRDDVSGGLNCADLEASCRDAAMMAMREDLHGAPEVRAEHLRSALEERAVGRLKTKRFTFSVGV